MNRVVLQACLPWLVLLAVLVAVAAVMVRLGGSRLRLSRLVRLHADQDGGAQSLSFVLTLPVFFIFVLAIIDVSQVTIGTMVVNYAAFAAARAAIVWIPAAINNEQVPEYANCINGLTAPSGYVPSDAPVAVGGITCEIRTPPNSTVPSAKYDKIRLAAALACTPICPSVGLSMVPDNITSSTVTSAQNVYGPMTGANASTIINARLQNKITYALASVPANSDGQAIQNPDGTPGLVTWVGLQVFHPSIEPPLFAAPPMPTGVPNPPSANYLSYFQANEIGWRDAVTVTVQHRMAIMVMVPGAGNILSKFFHQGFFSGGYSNYQPVYNGPELVTLPKSTTKVCMLPITASATLGVEGEKSQVPYVYSTQ